MIRDSDSRFDPLQAGENDKRITRIGKIIRPMALDELPQLWSIFTGDMSFVGPRALVPAEIEQRDESSEPVPIEEIPGYYERHSVRPGLTGLAQIYAAGDMLRRQKFRYDLLYIRNICFLLDLRLIALSFWISLYREVGG